MAVAQQRKIDQRTMKKARLKKATRDRESENKIQSMITIIFIVLLIFVLVKGITFFAEIKSQQNEVEQKYSDLKAKKIELEEELEYIGTPEYIENAAREKLKMVMPGEILYVLKDSTGSSD